MKILELSMWHHCAWLNTTGYSTRLNERTIILLLSHVL